MTPKPVDTGGVEGGGEKLAKLFDYIGMKCDAIDNDRWEPDTILGLTSDISGAIVRYCEALPQMKDLAAITKDPFTEKPSDPTGSQEGLAAIELLRRLAANSDARQALTKAENDAILAGRGTEDFAPRWMELRDEARELAEESRELLAANQSPPTPIERGDLGFESLRPTRQDSGERLAALVRKWNRAASGLGMFRAERQIGLAEGFKSCATDLADALTESGDGQGTTGGGV